MEVLTPRAFHFTKAHSMHKVGLSRSHSNEDEAITNSSVQVAIRVRPLVPQEDNVECIQLFSNHGVQSRSDHLTMLQSKFSSESTMSTLADSMQHSDSQKNFQSLQVGNGENAPAYTFDHVFPSITEQRDIYDHCVTPLVDSCLEGYNATVLAYGQTGSGKTHTIIGNVGKDEGDEDDNYTTGLEKEEEGVIPRALRGIFHGLDELKAKSARERSHSPDRKLVRPNLASSPPGSNQTQFEYSIKIQFVELYGEEIRDLLDAPSDTTTVERPLFRRTASYGNISTKSAATSRGKSKITIRDGKAGEGAALLGTATPDVKSVEDALGHLRSGLLKRVVAKTAMNAHSSRSHAIFTVVIHQTVRRQIGSDDTNASGEKIQVEMKTSKIHFVDLCGSERAKRAQTAGKRLKEGIDINKGLLNLGNVISALGKNGPKGHIPYRDSKLTRILKGSLGGNHKTLMIACVSPSSSNVNETVNTLRYANRAKNIKNNAKINVDPQYEVVNELREQVAALASELLRMRNQGSDDEEDYPFSLDFLSDLIKGSKSSRNGWRKRQSGSIHGLSSLKSFDEDLPKNMLKPRPATSPQASDTPDHTLQQVSWDIASIQSFDTQRDEFDAMGGEKSDWDADSAEDPELSKNIESYDFALVTLRNSVNHQIAKQSLRQTQNSSAMKSFQEELRNYDEMDDEASYQEGMNEVSPIPIEAVAEFAPESPPPALKKVRNISELYDYLNKNTFVNEHGDIVDDDGTVVSEVVNSHVTKLAGAISQNELLLKEMETSHEIFEVRRENERQPRQID